MMISEPKTQHESVLVVDDDPRFRSGIRRMMQLIPEPDSFNFLGADDGIDAMAVIQRQDVDCVLMDQSMPNGTGIDWLRRIRSGRPELPVIIVTGSGSEEIAVEAMKEGASDYLVKGGITAMELQRAVSNAIERGRMLETIERQKLELLDAERQRVMLESLATACHHLGQPATAITVCVEMIQKMGGVPTIEPLIDNCLEAVYDMNEKLQKLQALSFYQTEPYLLEKDENDAPVDRLLAL